MKSIVFYLTACVSMLCSLVTAATPSLQDQEQSLSVIKPDAVADNHIGDIISRFEKAHLRIVAIKMQQLTQEQAADFYSVHKERPFFKDLTTFMSSGPVVAMVVEGKNAIARTREIMGATDFTKAKPGTLRADFAKSITKNAVHGSDSVENAKTEIAFFFTPAEIISR